MSLRATVQSVRLIVDEATELPDGTVLDLVLDDEGDDLDEDGRRALDAAIAKSVEQAAAGRIAPVDDVLARLRGRRRG
ncbi:MAG: hypothetical protein IAG13_09440 [Deltaproteobacteria bacterium]|nr:hypothetical protein [Nannocystaceae bacterium]